MYAWGKKRKLLVFTAVYVCVKAKLTLVRFFSIFFFCTFPLQSTYLFDKAPIYNTPVPKVVFWNGKPSFRLFCRRSSRQEWMKRAWLALITMAPYCLGCPLTTDHLAFSFHKWEANHSTWTFCVGTHPFCHFLHRQSFLRNKRRKKLVWKFHLLHSSCGLDKYELYEL